MVYRRFESDVFGRRWGTTPSTAVSDALDPNAVIPDDEEQDGNILDASGDGDGGNGDDEAEESAEHDCRRLTEEKAHC